MSPSARRLASAAILTSIAASACAAVPALAEDRCTGTLCDFYYGSSAPEPTGKPAAPTPLTVPSGGILGFFGGNKPAATPAAPGTAATPAAPSRLQVQGGGLAAMARGEAPERCTGTLCDLFYGGPPPERPAAAPAAVPTAVAADAPDEAPLEEPVPRHRAAPREPTPSCAYDARDPWRCYRK